MARKLSEQEYFSRLKNKWIDLNGNQLNDYSNSKYNGMRENIEYICLKHGKQIQKAKVHLEIGCQECSNTRTLTKRKFIEKANQIHKNLYLYDKVKWINATTHVLIGCKYHGYWYQTPTNHLKGQGCPKCAYINKGNNLKLKNIEFIERAKQIHKESNLNYDKVIYTGENNKVIIKCNELDEFGNSHGEFLVIPRLFLIGKYKCPKCFNVKNSFGELTIIKFIKSIINCKTNVRNIISPNELDIYISDKKLAIEFDGLYWHSDEFKTKNYHLEKTEACEKQGIQLIHIFEDEWLEKQEIVKSRLLNILGKSKWKLYARNLKIKQVPVSLEKYFFNKNHLQGYIPSQLCYGLFWLHEGKEYLVSSMSFGLINESRTYEMYRFCNALNYSIPGAAQKLFKYFLKQINPNKVISYADRRWSTNIKHNLYNQLGFEFINYEKPKCFYSYGTKRYIEKNCQDIVNYNKIYDSGQLKYEFN